MFSDSPSPSWYEPPDDFECDDDPCPLDPEPLVISGDVVSWTAPD